MNRKPTPPNPLLASSAALWRAILNLALLVAALLPAQAQQDPPNCRGSGLGIALFVDKENAHVGDTLFYSALVYNNPFPSCKAGDVQAWIVTPDGKTNNLALKRTTLNPGDSDMYENVISYVVRAQDMQDGVVKARATDTAKIYQNETPSAGAAAQGVNTVIYNPCINITTTCVNGFGQNGVINYSATVRNCGDIDLIDVRVTNYITGGTAELVHGPIALAKGASATFTGSYVPPEPCAPATARLVVTGRDTITAFKVVVAEASSTCNLVFKPAIAMSQACSATAPLPGQPLVYTGAVTNTGDVTLLDVVVVADQPAAGTVVHTIPSLLPGAVSQFNGSFPAPANTCQVTTRLSVAGKSACNVAVAASTSATCPITATPAIEVVKICPTVPVAPGGVLNYSGIVKNTGDVTLRQVRVVSDKPAAGTVVFQADSLLPGASATFTASYTVPADACSVTDTLTAGAVDNCSPRTVTASTTTSCPLTVAPGIAITRACPPNAPAPGEKLNYAGTVRNTGNVTLIDVVVVSDRPVAGTVVATIPTLAPGVTAPYTGSFDVPVGTDTCAIENIVSVSAKDKCGAVAASDAVRQSCPIATTPGLVVTKACPTVPTPAGGVLTYAGTVRNSGNVSLTNIVVTSDRPTAGSVIARIETLVPGATADFTGSFTVPADVNGCSITSGVRATAIDKCQGRTVVSNEAITECPVLTTPLVTITKICPPQPPVAGTPLIYGGVVSNRGNVTLTNVVVVSDRPVAGTVVFTRPLLAPGAAVTFSAQYVTAAGACETTDTLSVTTASTCGQAVANSTTTTCPLLNVPRLQVTQVCASEPATPGSTVKLLGTVRNAGDVALTNVIVTSDRPAAGTVVFTAALIEPGATLEFSSSFTTPFDTCSVTSTLNASAASKCSGVTVTDRVTTLCNLVTTPGIAVDKVCPAEATLAGTFLNFTGTVANTGNITLTNVVVTSDRPAPGTVVFTTPRLAPGAVTNFTGRYQVPATLNDCAITDTVRATARDICQLRVVTSEKTSSCPVRSEPKIKVVKVCPGTAVAPGEKLVYAGSVSNPGLVTLKNVSVTSDLPTPGTVVFTAASLAPGATANFTGNFIAPLNACNAGNTLTATATDICGTGSASDQTTVSCPLVTTPKLALTRACALVPVYPGEETYVSGTVTNVGNITLTNVIVMHSLPAIGTRIFGPVTLQPGEGASFTGSYHVPAVVTSCAIATELSASGNDICAGRPTTDRVTGNCAIATRPSITITKDCSPTPVTQGTIAYYFARVKNTGDIALNDIVVRSDQPAEGTVVYRLATLPAHTEVQFVGSSVVPFNCCSFTTTLSVEAREKCTEVVVADTSTTTCPVLYTPAVKITKICPLKPSLPGDKMVYTGTVANPGNITLIDVVVYSAQLGTTSPLLGPIDLAPGETVPYSAEIMVSSDWCGADTVTVEGTTLCGRTKVTDKVTSVCPVETKPAVALAVHSPGGPVERGTPITLTGTVSNPGNVNLVDVMVYSDQPTNGTPAFGPITLAAGTSTNFTFTFTENKCKCCELVTTLRVRGKDRCTGKEVTASSTTVTPFLTKPALMVHLVCPTGTSIGGTARYHGHIENTGDIPLSNVVAVATLPTGTKLFGPITLAPGETEAFSGSFTRTTESDLDSLTVSATGMDICNGATVSAADGCGAKPSSSGIDITTIVRGESGVALTWSAVPGHTYRLQCQTNLGNAVWTDVAGDVTANSSTATKVDPNPAAGRCFYRVMRVSSQSAGQ